jgi:hypothetical protein
MRQIDALVGGMCLLWAHTADPGTVHPLRGGGIGIDTWGLPPDRRQAAMRLGWTWDTEVDDESTADQCWKFWPQNVPEAVPTTAPKVP